MLASKRSLDARNMDLRKKTVGTIKGRSFGQLLSRVSDYRCFQELLMGQGVKLQLQVPVQLITFTRYNEGKPSKQSELQYLRLWQSGQHQYVMFFCNATTGKYREYKSQ